MLSKFPGKTDIPQQLRVSSVIYQKITISVYFFTSTNFVSEGKLPPLDPHPAQVCLKDARDSPKLCVLLQGIWPLPQTVGFFSGISHGRGMYLQGPSSSWNWKLYARILVLMVPKLLYFPGMSVLIVRKLLYVQKRERESPLVRLQQRTRVRPIAEVWVHVYTFASSLDPWPSLGFTGYGGLWLSSPTCVRIGHEPLLGPESVKTRAPLSCMKDKLDTICTVNDFYGQVVPPVNRDLTTERHQEPRARRGRHQIPHSHINCGCNWLIRWQ